MDHALLHGGYLGRLSHAALALYLFLVVVGDREGRSFYSDALIGDILRLSGLALTDARCELLTAGLVRYQQPYWRVDSLTRAGPTATSPRPCVSAPVRLLEDRPPSPAPVSVHGIVPDALKALIRSLEERP